MPASELAFWEYWYSQEFLGNEREDYRSSRLEATIINWKGKVLKEDVEVSPLNLMPFREREPESEEEISSNVSNVFNAIIGMQKRGQLKEEAELAQLKKDAEDRMNAARDAHSMRLSTNVPFGWDSKKSPYKKRG